MLLFLINLSNFLGGVQCCICSYKNALMPLTILQPPGMEEALIWCWFTSAPAQRCNKTSAGASAGSENHTKNITQFYVA